MLATGASNLITFTVLILSDRIILRIMRFFITQFSSVSYYFLSLWSKYFPQHTVPKYHYKSTQQHIFIEQVSNENIA
jgi:hypothetical protein